MPCYRVIHSISLTRTTQYYVAQINIWNHSRADIAQTVLGLNSKANLCTGYDNFCATTSDSYPRLIRANILNYIQ
jgi:hypothetical protein